MCDNVRVNVVRRTMQVEQPVASLVWAGDRLFDPIGAPGLEIGNPLPAWRKSPKTAYFDLPLSNRAGTDFCAYKQLGTKAILFNSQNEDELDRSYYHANVTPFPISFLSLNEPDDTLAYATEYDTLVLKPLLQDKQFPPSHPADDFFHGRLEISPSGRWLMSHGWIWHPYSDIMLIDLDIVREDPSKLNSFKTAMMPEPEGCAFLADDSVVLAPMPQDETYSWGEHDAQAKTLWVVEPSTRKVLHRVGVDVQPKRMMALGTTHVVDFEGYPKVIELAAGHIVLELSDLSTGTTQSYPCAVHPTVPLALDPGNNRFAFGEGRTITIVEFSV